MFMGMNRCRTKSEESEQRVPHVHGDEPPRVSALPDVSIEFPMFMGMNRIT